MVSSIQSNRPLIPRLPRSAPASYPGIYVKIKPYEAGAAYLNALLVDISNNGLGLITSAAMPVGTRVAINFKDQYYSVGEIVDCHNTALEDGPNMNRLCVHLVDKRDWPLHLR